MHLTTLSISVTAEIITTGMCFRTGSSIISFKTWYPSTSGIMMSRSTRSNSPARTISSARRPFSASATECPCCSRRRESRSRFISTSSTTRSRPVSVPIGLASEKAAQERELPGRGFFSALDHVGVERGVAQADVPIERRHDRDDLGVMRRVVERISGFQEVIHRDARRLGDEAHQRPDPLVQRVLEAHREDDVAPFLDGDADGKGIRGAAVTEQPPPHGPRGEEDWDLHRGADGVPQAALREDDALAGLQVRRDEIERDPRILEGRLAVEALEDGLQAALVQESCRLPARKETGKESPKDGAVID